MSTAVFPEYAPIIKAADQLAAIWAQIVKNEPEAHGARAEPVHHLYPLGYLTDPIMIAVEDVRNVWCELLHYDFRMPYTKKTDGQLIPQISMLIEDGDRRLLALYDRLCSAMFVFAESDRESLQRYSMKLRELVSELRDFAYHNPDLLPRPDSGLNLLLHEGLPIKE